METIRQHKNEQCRRLRTERRQKGLCIDCNTPTTSGHTRCPRCLMAMAYRRRQKRIINGDEVRRKAHQYRIDHIEHLRELDNKSSMKMRTERREKGLCGECGREPVAGLLYCALCLFKSSIRKRRYRQTHRGILSGRGLNIRKQYLIDHRCYRCGTPLIEDETKYCIVCLTTRSNPVMKGVLKYEVAN